jgi:hypothetical protein
VAVLARACHAEIRKTEGETVPRSIERYNVSMSAVSTSFRSFIRVFSCVTIAANCALVLPCSVNSADRPKVKRETDLPQFNYPMTLTAQALLTSDATTFGTFAARVKRDLESIFLQYEIVDNGVLVQLLSHKVDLEMLFREDAEALKTCGQMRVLVDRPDFKATGMFNDLSFIRARMATGRSDGEAFHGAYKKDFGSLVESLPWDVVAERVKKARNNFERLSADYVETRVAADIEPYVGQHQALDFRLATKLIFWRGTLMTEVPQRQIVLDILNAYIEKHDSSAPR